jgi:hypothetical protein
MRMQNVLQKGKNKRFFKPDFMLIIRVENFVLITRAFDCQEVKWAINKLLGFQTQIYSELRFVKVFAIIESMFIRIHILLGTSYTVNFALKSENNRKPIHRLAYIRQNSDINPAMQKNMFNLCLFTFNFAISEGHLNFNGKFPLSKRFHSIVQFFSNRFSLRFFPALQ